MPNYKGTRLPNGAGTMNDAGYRITQLNGVRKREHVRIVETVLGRELRDAERVHHINENRGDNRNENLVLCPNQEYHSLLHTRMKAFAACGNYDWRKCHRCGAYDAQSHLKRRPGGSRGLRYAHSECEAAHTRACKHRRRAQLLDIA